MAANHNIILWAVPRFRRPARQFTLDNLPGMVEPGGTAREDARGLDEGMLKAVAEGIAENPDGAARYICLRYMAWIHVFLSRHAWVIAPLPNKLTETRGCIINKYRSID